MVSIHTQDLCIINFKEIKEAKGSVRSHSKQKTENTFWKEYIYFSEQIPVTMKLTGQGYSTYRICYEQVQEKLSSCSIFKTLLKTHPGKY